MTASDGTVSNETSELTYRFSPSEPPSKVVLEATAEATESCEIGLTASVDENVLDPLYETIDPDVLDTLFRPTSSGQERFEGRISFVYQGCEVEVLSSGVVRVQQEREVGEPIETND